MGGQGQDRVILHKICCCLCYKKGEDHRKLLMTQLKVYNFLTPLEQPSRSHCVFLPGMSLAVATSVGRESLLPFAPSYLALQGRQMQQLELTWACQQWRLLKDERNEGQKSDPSQGMVGQTFWNKMATSEIFFFLERKRHCLYSHF